MILFPAVWLAITMVAVRGMNSGLSVLSDEIPIFGPEHVLEPNIAPLGRHAGFANLAILLTYPRERILGCQQAASQHIRLSSEERSRTISPCYVAPLHSSLMNKALRKYLGTLHECISGR